MEVNTQRTLSSDLFSHEMVHCVLGISLHSIETAVKHVFFLFFVFVFVFVLFVLTSILGPDGKKKVFFPV